MNAFAHRQAIQRLLGVKPDGVFGPATHRAAEVLGSLPDDAPWPDYHSAQERLAPRETAVTPPPAPVAEGAVDERSEGVIATLHRRVQPVARQLVRVAAAQGITIRLLSGTRTFAEQDALYAQGRTKPGGIVTNARAGHSNHNFGIAFDIGIFQGAHYVAESPLYARVGALGKALGLAWGGDWQSIQDEPHFELHPAWAEGWTEATLLAELRDRHEVGRDVFA